MGQGRNGGGPLSVWPTLLDVLQRPSLDRCCRHLRGVRVSSRTEKPRSGMWSKQWARQTQGAPPAHPPAQTYTHTPLFAPPCCSQPTVQRCGATQDLNRKPKGCSLCCSIPLHGTWIFGSQRTLASGEACPGRWLCPHTQPHSGCTWSYLPGFKPGPPRQSWEHFLTSPPVPVLSPALRMFWPGS